MHTLILSILSFLAVATMCCRPGLAASRDFVRVTLFAAQGPLKQIHLDGPFVVDSTRRLVEAGRYIVLSERNEVAIYGSRNRLITRSATGLKLSGPRGAPIQLVSPSLTPVLQSEARKLRRTYRGTIELKARAGQLSIVNTVPTKDYVVSVVGSETNHDFPVEALKAQVVLTQTRLARYHTGDQLADTTQTEAYMGATHERTAVRAALNCVWGQTLTWEKRPVTVFYHSTCAGGTSTASEYFHLKAHELPYLKGVPCHHCQASPFYRPTVRTITRSSFQKAFRLSANDQKDPEITRRDPAGRPLSLKLPNGKSATGYQFWLRLGQNLGWDRVPGTRYAFVAAPQDHVRITSTGAGHGVGLCQWGAAGLARSGKTYKEILSYYYPGTGL